MANSPPRRSTASDLSAISFFLLRRRSQKPIQHPEIGNEVEQRMARTISRLLRFGILLSASIVLIGAILYFARHGTSIPIYSVFSSEPNELRSLSGICAAARALSARGIIQFGLLILVATPVARVALALLNFHLIGDRLYVLVAGIVLITLILSLANPPV